MNKSGVRSESTEQIIFIARVRQFHPGIIAFAIPNGGKRDPREAARMKREGVLAGVPDVFVALKKEPYGGLFIEMKNQLGGSVSESQKRIQAALIGSGYKVVTCNGANEAYRVFLDYVGLG